jgi:hypothetical protein
LRFDPAGLVSEFEGVGDGLLGAFQRGLFVGESFLQVGDLADLPFGFLEAFQVDGVAV